MSPRSSTSPVSPTGSSQAPLDIINEWWRNRLSVSAGTHGKPPVALRQLQEAFIERSLEEIKRQLGHRRSAASRYIVTVRSSFCKAKQYLRPVYSFPGVLGDFLRDPENQKPFRMDWRKAFQDVTYYLPENINDSNPSFIASYKIDSTTPPTEHCFAGRINSLRSRLSGRTDDLGRLAASVTHCLFAGRNKEPDSPTLSPAAPQREELELQHLMAIYYRSRRADPLPSSLLQRLNAATTALFSGLDLIARIDASIFESEGLELVAQLLPLFSRNDTAPSDKIAFAIERLRSLFKSHMIGRHGGDVAPSLFYIATTFEKVGNAVNAVVPRLEVYPHAYREAHPEVSFLVTHRHIPSATKFLVWRYFQNTCHAIVAATAGSAHAPTTAKQHPIVVADSFARLFDSQSLKIGPGTNWYDAVTPPSSPDFLLLTKLDSDDGPSNGQRTPWEALQRAADPKSRAIAAFVVEGRSIPASEAGTGAGDVPCRCLPRGLFAIESQYEDGFSDEDIKSLRIVFRGLASLIRMISHPHAPIDFRSRIADTYQDDVDASIDDEHRRKVRELLFLVQKLDATLLARLLDETVCDLMKYGIGESNLSVLRQIARICPPADHPSSPDDRADLLLRRMTGMQDLLKREKNRLPDFLTDEVMACLEACPENFTWASYLACMAQALGDRMDAGKEPPQFMRMQPGFSASGMFMAMVRGELRQVVKLANTEKLRSEVSRYRRWVRYRLVNAARLPDNGFAFDTDGSAGQRLGATGAAVVEDTTTLAEYAGSSDGVLVSDLVSAGTRGQGKVRTLLDQVAIAVSDPQSEPDITSLCNEIQAVFGRNAVLWQTVPTGEVPPAAEQMGTVFDAFRLRGPEAKAEIDRAMHRLAEMRRSPIAKATFSEVMGTWRGGGRQLPPLDPGDDAYWVIGHGDMNARNLTWAEGLHSLFLIDFEYVGPSPRGCDQFRLAVNLVAELWTAIDSTVLPNRTIDVSKLHNGCVYLAAVFEILISTNGDHTLSTILNEIDTSQDPFVRVLLAITKTIEPSASGKADEYATAWRWHWALILFCAALKEFSYTCRLAPQEVIQDIAGSIKVETAAFDDVTERVKQRVKEQPGAKRLTYICIRHLASARLLIQLIQALEAQ